MAAVRNDIEPVWASEIEGFPIQVTKQRFPAMLHVGDITQLKGCNLPSVDIITGGSAVSGSECGWQESWSCRRTVRFIYGTNSDYKGDETDR